MTVRTRIAPSPTGDPHVGTAYVALFNFCFTRANQGRFLMRIEDTDLARSNRQSERNILDALRWLGLDWDEGPDKGGPFGPYRQSERRHIYTKYITRLLAGGHAFHCFCSRERLAALRTHQQKHNLPAGYDGACLKLSRAEVQARLAAGENSVIRMKVPTHGTCKVQDLLRGAIHIDWRQVDMQVLMKTDGMPTYHLACVVDDHLMQISHIIRGEEWISSAPKHLLLYEYLDWEPPILCHLPLLRNPDKSKLSKRRNPTSIGYYRDKGYLPETLLNSLARMGWAMPDEREVFTLDEMIEVFAIENLQPGEPIFSMDKLDWLNGQWLRRLDLEDYTRRLSDWLFPRERLHLLMPAVQKRIERFSQLAPQMAYLFGDLEPLPAENFKHRTLLPEDMRKILQLTLWRLQATENWDPQSLQDALVSLAKAMDLKIRDFLTPLFISISGRQVAFPLYLSMSFLGRDLTCERLAAGIASLGGISKKELKKYERISRTFS